MAKSKKPVVIIETVPLAKIERSGGTQARTGNNEDTIVDYFEALKAQKSLPPPVVFKDSNGKLWLADGFHRVEAHARFGSKTISVERHIGERRDAVLHAAGANAHHGLRRTREDKHRAVALLLDDPEWATWGDRRIAEHCHVSRDLVHAAMKATGRTASSVTTGSDGKTRNTAGIAAANRERAVERQASATANTLTSDSAPLPPAKPRLSREGAQEDPGDGLPVVQREDLEEEAEGGELVEDGAMAAPVGPVDAAGVPVPAILLPVWEKLAAGAEYVDGRLAAATRAWSDFQGTLLAHVRSVGSDAHLPSRENTTLDNDFGPAGRVHAMQAALRRMVPHVVCDACDGAGCARCGHLGWFSRVGWKERCRVDGRLDAVGAGD